MVNRVNPPFDNSRYPPSAMSLALDRKPFNSILMEERRGWAGDAAKPEGE